MSKIMKRSQGEGAKEPESASAAFLGTTTENKPTEVNLAEFL